MSIAYDTKGAGFNGTAVAATPITFSDTAASGADVFLVVEHVTTALTVSAVTYNGSAMTSVAAVSHPSSGGRTLVYHLAGAGTGSSVTVSLTPSSGQYLQAEVFSYTGVASIGTAVTNSGSSSSPAATAVTLSAGQVAFGAIGYGFPSASAGPMTSPTGSGATNRHLVNGPLNSSGMSVSDSSTSGVVFGATLNVAGNWSAATIVMSPSGSVSTPKIPTLSNVPVFRSAHY